MTAELGLIEHLTIALGAAFVAGFVVARVGLPPLVGYLLAGVLLGPATPGPIADLALATQLANIGIVLLMFGVGVQLSVRELLPVWREAVVGVAIQTVILTLAGMGLARLWGWTDTSGVLLGLAASSASTVVGTRVLMERNLLDSTPGRLAVGSLIVDDLQTVVLMLIVPSVVAGVPGARELPWFWAVAISLGKAFVFGVLMFFVGARFVPWLLLQVARIGSRELMVLGVFGVVLGVALLSQSVFGLSLALGAFVAGLVVSESDLSHHVAAESLPLRDAFSVLFFIAAGMLFDPVFTGTHLGPVGVFLVMVMVFKPLIFVGTVLALGHSWRTALLVATTRAQIGEFSFLLGTVGLSLGLMSTREYSLLLAATVLSIGLNPAMFHVARLLEGWEPVSGLSSLRRAAPGAEPRLTAGEDPERLRGHVVLCGYGQVGRVIAHALSRRGLPFLVVDQDRRQVEALRRRGIRAIYGDAGHPMTLDLAGVGRARAVVVAISDPIVARRVADHVRKANPRVAILVRTQSEAERAVLERLGADEVVLADLEVGLEMVRHVLRRFGISPLEIQGFVQGLRSSLGYPTAEGPRV